MRTWGGVGKSIPHRGNSECQGHEGESTAGVYEETWLERGEPGKSRGREVRGHGSGDAGCIGPCTYDDFGFKFK